MNETRTGTAVRTYYGQPVLKQPEWTWEVPWYLFVGGMAGAASVLSAVARRAGDDVLADRAAAVAAIGAVVSPPLLISDLGRPSRFLNMLRVFRPTSAMSVGSWTLAAWSGAVLGSQAAPRAGLPGLGRFLDGLAGVLGLQTATYTGVLVADSSVPVWHEARRHLPPLFAASAVASAGAATALITPGLAGEPARRLAVGGAAAALAGSLVMERQLGEVGEVYDQDRAGRFAKLAKACTGVGAVTCAAAGWMGRRSRGRRLVTALGAVLVLVGSLAERWAVFRAGFQSAADPKYVVGPQRRRKNASP